MGFHEIARKKRRPVQKKYIVHLLDQERKDLPEILKELEKRASFVVRSVY